MRLIVSIELPGAFGTSMRTARVGKSCAGLCDADAAKTSAQTADRNFLSISISSKRHRAAAALIGSRQVQHVLRDGGEHQIGLDRRDLVEARLAELALDGVFLGEAEAAPGLPGHVSRP